jgi:hypothetical protein
MIRTSQPFLLVYRWTCVHQHEHSSVTSHNTAEDARRIAERRYSPTSDWSIIDRRTGEEVPR